jgi:hypothetical protein
MIKTARQWGQPIDIVAEPIDPGLKACILTNLWAHPRPLHEQLRQLTPRVEHAPYREP